MIQFTVLGSPMSQGSKSAYVVGGRAIVVESKGVGRERHKSWREAVRSEAQRYVEMNPGFVVLDEPLHVGLGFRLARPKSAPKRVVHPAKGLDLDKLCRSVFDALTGVIWVDDSRVCALAARKFYDSSTGCSIEIETMT